MFSHETKYSWVFAHKLNKKRGEGDKGRRERMGGKKGGKKGVESKEESTSAPRDGWASDRKPS